jgi:BirA family biotin operon repressor/biotin-[acetyl-CoA-carboxylase] ligase
VRAPYPTGDARTPNATCEPATSTAALAATRFRDVRWFAAIDSTNRYLLAEAAPGGAEGLVAVADEQTAGRGRLGRTWSRAPGPRCSCRCCSGPPPARAPHLVTLAAGGRGDRRGRATVGGFEAGLKWPNDLVVDDRKLAGILAEADGAGAVVVGMGSTCSRARVPAELATSRPPAIAGRPVDRERCWSRGLRAYDDGWLDALDAWSPTPPRRSATIGRRVRVELARETFEGTATGAHRRRASS